MGIRRNVACLAVACLALLVFGAARASAQSVNFDFEDGTDQGWGTGFGDDASASFTIANIGGSMRMFVPLGGFQVAGNAHGSDGSAFYTAMQAAAANEAGATVSYDYYIDTSTFVGTTFFQLGSFVNTGSGYYAQNFPATGKEAELSQAQVDTHGVFTGHVSYLMTAALPSAYDMPAADTFFRLGLIQNGNGTGAGVYYDNINVTVVPEPASLALLGLGGLGLVGAAYRRSRG